MGERGVQDKLVPFDLVGAAFWTPVELNNRQQLYLSDCTSMRILCKFRGLSVLHLSQVTLLPGFLGIYCIVGMIFAIAGPLLSYLLNGKNLGQGAFFDSIPNMLYPTYCEFNSWRPDNSVRSSDIRSSPHSTWKFRRVLLGILVSDYSD